MLWEKRTSLISIPRLFYKIWDVSVTGNISPDAPSTCGIPAAVMGAFYLYLSHWVQLEVTAKVVQSTNSINQIVFATQTQITP